MIKSSFFVKMKYLTYWFLDTFLRYSCLFYIHNNQNEDSPISINDHHCSFNLLRSFEQVTDSFAREGQNDQIST